MNKRSVCVTENPNFTQCRGQWIGGNLVPVGTPQLVWLGEHRREGEGKVTEPGYTEVSLHRNGCISKTRPMAVLVDMLKRKEENLLAENYPKAENYRN